MYVVFVFVLALAAAASQAYGSEMSLKDWWEQPTSYVVDGYAASGYGLTYGSFDSCWQWLPLDVWTDGTSVHTLQIEMAAMSNNNATGWFDLSTDATDYNPGALGNGYHEIFAGTDSAPTTKTITIPQYSFFDFYMHTGEGKTWHSYQPNDSNPDTYMDHQWLFVSTNAAWTALHDSETPGNDPVAYLQAWEDQSHNFTIDPTEKHWVKQGSQWVYDPNSQDGHPLWWTNGEPDNNDMVLTFWTDKNLGQKPLPEPGSLGLLAMALCGGIAAGRKRWSR